ATGARPEWASTAARSSRLQIRVPDKSAHVSDKGQFRRIFRNPFPCCQRPHPSVMTSSQPSSSLQERPRRLIGPGVILLVIALLILIGFGYCASRLVPGGFLGRNETSISHDLVVQQVRAVAKLVSSEATVRDVIVY